MAHVIEDASATLAVFENVSKKKAVMWVSEKKQPAQISLSKPLTVLESMALPIPDTSWMKQGNILKSLIIFYSILTILGILKLLDKATRSREQFTDWLNPSTLSESKE